MPDLELLGNNDGEWVSIPIVVKVNCVLVEKTLSPEESAIIEYIPSFWSDKNFLNFTSYKFGFKYTIENDESAFEKYDHFEVYSNEFRISGEDQKIISAVTDKTDYQSNEEVKLVIYNKEAIRIYTISVERIQNNEWMIIRGDIRCTCGILCERAIQTLSAGTNRDFIWDQKEAMCGKSGKGKYRFQIDWGPEGLDLFVPKISYSNEFLIKGFSNQLFL